MEAREGIKHVIVLMLENRSFDCMLGKLYQAGPGFDGLTGNESNPDPTTQQAVKIDYSKTLDDYAAVIPNPDPGEEFVNMNEQLFGGDRTIDQSTTCRNTGRPPMTGFVANYLRQRPGFVGHLLGDPCPDPQDMMHYFTSQQLPVLSQLAMAFGVSDQWHASAPCQTWPNRLFAHTGTCRGYVNNDDFLLNLEVPFPAPSIFGLLSQNNRSWRIYYHDFPQSIILGDAVTKFWQYRDFGQFLADAHAGVLPDYSFIEPHYFSELLFIPNDQHPPHNVLPGEKLIAQVYNALRGSPCWKESLLVITWDEHGGCYDHAPPPHAISPDGLGHSGFTFDRYGVRVPAVIVSPWIAPSVVRSAPHGIAFDAPPYPFDHTSIIKTVRQLFNLGPALTERDNAAPSLLPYLTLPAPTNDGPPSINCATPEVSRTARREQASAPPDSNQQALAQLAMMLPGQPPAPGASAPQLQIVAPTTFENALTAGAHAIARLKSFLGL
jgi:phospholipase C